MKILFIEGNAFVELPTTKGVSNYLLYIGSREAVENSTVDQVLLMVTEALAHNAFNSISSSDHQTVN